MSAFAGDGKRWVWVPDDEEGFIAAEITSEGTWFFFLPIFILFFDFLCCGLVVV